MSHDPQHPQHPVFGPLAADSAAEVVARDTFAQAVATLQHELGLTVDGIAGPKTCKAAGATTKAPRAVAIEPTGGVADDHLGGPASAPTGVPLPAHTGRPMRTQDAVTSDAPKEVDEHRTTLDVNARDER